MNMKRMIAATLLAMFLCTFLTGCGLAETDHSGPTAGPTQTETPTAASATGRDPVTELPPTEAETVPTAVPTAGPEIASEPERPAETAGDVTEPA